MITTKVRRGIVTVHAASLLVVFLSDCLTRE